MERAKVRGGGGGGGGGGLCAVVVTKGKHSLEGRAIDISMCKFIYIAESPQTTV